MPGLMWSNAGKMGWLAKVK